MMISKEKFVERFDASQAQVEEVSFNYVIILDSKQK